MIEIVKQLVEILGTASPVIYVFAYAYLLGKILTPILIFSGLMYVVYAFRSCMWWMVRDEIVKRIRDKRIVVDGEDGVDESKDVHRFG